jgi:hypothetical protein
VQSNDIFEDFRKKSVEELERFKNYFCLGPLLPSIWGQKLRNGSNELKIGMRGY